MDFKTKILELKKNYFNLRVRKLTLLIELYNEYIDLIKEETIKKVDNKVLIFKEKKYREFQEKYFDIAKEEEIFDVVYNTKHYELVTKKRLEFRAYREKTLRQIKKLEKKNQLDNIEQLRKSIDDFEKLKNDEVEQISASWKEEFKKELEVKKANNLSTVEVDKLKEDIENQISDYRKLINQKAVLLEEKRIKRIHKKLAKFEKNLAKNNSFLQNYIELYTLKAFDNVKIEQVKKVSELEDNIKTNQEQVKLLKEKLKKEDSKNKNEILEEITKREKVISLLEDELNSFKQTFDQTNLYIKEDEVLNIHNLCMYFGGIKAVNNLSFSVKKNEIFGLIGPNGAGKTTVFNCITQFYKPTSGQITFRKKNGDVINLINEKVHNVILHGIVRTFQNLEVIKDITVIDNLLVAAHRNYVTNIFQHMIHSPLFRVEEKVLTRRAVKVLDFLGLLKYKDMYAWGLPYGILKKIEIGRTLMCDPQLIILDEPAAGLNDSETVELINIIKQIRDTYDATILLVEHDMGLVMNVCNRICAISFGNLLSIDTPSGIQKNKLVQEAYLGVQEE